MTFKSLRTTRVSALLGVVVGITSQASFASDATAEDIVDPIQQRLDNFENYIPAYTVADDEVIIKFKGAATQSNLLFSRSHSQRDQVLARINAKKSKRLRPEKSQKGASSSRSRSAVQAQTKTHPLDDTWVVTLNNRNAKQVIDQLKTDPSIEYVEPNYHYQLHAVPNDPYYNTQGAWQQSFDDLYGLKQIDAAQAWDTTEGQGVVVAVIDTGVDITHPDLAANIWVNPNEIAGNGIDDDNNGYVDDVHGWNFHGDNNDLTDDVGHGTHVAGTVAAVGNNATGVIGVAPKSKIMPVRALGATYQSEAITLDDLAQSVIYAVDNGADVINASWGGPHSQTISAAVKYAYDNDVVFVASSGNDGLPAFLKSPAGLADAITVGANDHTDTLAGFSNWGAGVDISGPGVEVLSTAAPNGSYNHYLGEYGVISGTSMSAPHVAGAVALIRAVYPQYNVEQVRYALREGATDAFETGYDVLFGHGRLDALQSINVNDAPLLTARIAIVDPDALVGNNHALVGTANGADFSSYRLELAEVYFDQPLQYQTLFTGNQPVSNGILGNIDLSNIDNGWYLLKLTVEDNAGREMSAESFVRFDKDLKAGWPQSVSANNISTPTAPNRAATFADINGDGESELIGTDHHNLYAWNADGSSLAGFPVALPHPSAGAVSFYDLDQDGNLDILTPVSATDGSGEIHAYNLYGQSVPGFPVSLGLSYSAETVQLDFSRGISIVDLNGDDTPELLSVIKAVESYNPFYGYKSGDLYIAVSDLSGNTIGEWPKQVGYASNYNAGEILLLDRNQDGNVELLTVTGISKSFAHDYFFTQYSFDGRFESEVKIPSLSESSSAPSTVVHSTLATDLDNDGTLEVAIITGRSGGLGLSVALLDQNLELLPGWPRKLPSHGLDTEFGAPLPIKWPLVALDINDNGTNELIYVRGDIQYAFNKDGSTAPGHPFVINGRARIPEPYGAVFAPVAESPVIATFFASGSYVYATDNTGTPLTGWRRYQGNVAGSLAAGNMGNDNTLEIASISSKGYAYLWEVPLSGQESAGPTWQTFGGDIKRSFHKFSDATPNYTSTKPSMFVRGSFNGWAASEMSLVANNVWEATITAPQGSATQFKFDVLGDWSDNYGDSNNDGIAESFAGNISVPGGQTYRVQLNDSTLAYTVNTGTSSSGGGDCIYPIGTAKFGPFTYQSQAMTCENGLWIVQATNDAYTFEFTELDGSTTTYGLGSQPNSVAINGAEINIDYQGASSGTLTVNLLAETYSFEPTVTTSSCDRAYMTLNYVRNGSTFRQFEGMDCNNGEWQITLNVYPALTEDFRFDMENKPCCDYLGDDDGNGILDQNGAPVAFPQGAGEYLITVNDSTLAYSITRIGGDNQPPVAAISGSSIIAIDPDQAEVVTLDGSISYDPEGSDLTFDWYVSGPGVRLMSTDDEVTSIAFDPTHPSVSNYARYVTLVVTDSTGQSSSAFVYVTQIRDASVTPDIDAGQDVVVPLSGGTISLNGVINNAITPSNVYWGTLGSNALFQEFSDRFSLATEVAIPPASNPYTTYTIVLTVANEQGFASKDELTVSYANSIAQVFPSLFVRGNFNGWAADAPMTLISDNTWETEIVVPAGNQSVKFDVLGDWTQNYGDANNDGIAEQGAGNIAITQGAGTYTVTFNDATLSYSFVKQSTQQAPIADAGADQSVSGSAGSVTLSGSNSSDPDGQIVSYWWTQVSGPVVSIANPASVTTNVALPTVTTTTEYTFAINVTDNDGLTDSDFVTITQNVTSLSKTYNQVYARGHFNGWGTKLMTLVDNFTWETTVTLDGTANQQLKFDVNGDWSLNFGDNNADGTAEQGGNNINFPASTGTYTIQFNDQTKQYTIQ